MEMEGREDPFAYLITFSRPTASQEAIFLNCPFARESENFLESNQDLISSSPESTASEPTGIVMVSPPDSAGNFVGRNSSREDEPLFHTPPEEQNPDESLSDGGRTVDLGNGFDERKRGKCVEGEMDDGVISKRRRVQEKDMDGETMAIDEIVQILNEIDENEGVQDYTNTEVIDLDGTEFVEDSTGKIHLPGFREGEVVETEKIGEDEEVAKNLLLQIDANKECKALMIYSGPIANVEKNECANLNQNDNSCGASSSGKFVSNGHVGICEERRISGVGSNRNKCDDGKQRICVGNINEEIEKSKYVSGDERGSGKKIRNCDNYVVATRELPSSMKGKSRGTGSSQNEATETTRINNELLRDFLNTFNVVAGDANDGCGDMDFLEIAKRRGLTFPRPRWWPSEDGK